MRIIASIQAWILTNTTEESDDRGASLVEYALLLALLALVCIAAVTALGSTTSESFSVATSKLG